MEDFVRKTKGVRDIKSLPLDTSHELDIVSDVKGKIYIKILNRYKELLFDNGTEPWVTEMLNNLEVDVEQLKEDVLDLEQALTELPIIEDKLEAVETKLAQINTLFAQMQIDVQGLDLRTAELEREVIQLALKDQELLDKINNLDLGKITNLYSNSIDFGDYDYSGNPNVMNNLSFSDFAVQSGAGTISDGGNFLKINKTSGTNLYVMAGYKNSAYYLTPVLSNTTYTISYTLRKSSNFVPQSGKRIIMRYRLNQNDVTNNLGELILDSTNVNDEFTTYTKTFTTGVLVNPNSYYFQVLVEEGLSGEIELSYEIKLERGSTSTPYQPNLLDAPYYLSKAALGKNIADPTKVFPIKTSLYNIYLGKNTEKYQLNQTYTITMKATKPSTQQFGVFLLGGAMGVGNMKPVEGLSDVWQLTFKVTQAHLDAGVTDVLSLYQAPQSTVGVCQIDWLKLEKGDTRTPNIPYHKYVGINLKESENPKDYEWIPLASAAETVDARLSKTISTYDTVNALQNNRLTALESKVVDTTWQNVTVTEPFTSVTQPQVKKQNGIVYMRGTISNGTGDCFTLPEGFRPPAGAYEMQFRLPCRSASAADYATIYVRPSGLCSIAGVNGTMPIFLSGIIFSTT